MKIQNRRSYPLMIDNVLAQPGEVIEVPDDIGNAAVEQPANWAKPKSRKPADDGDKKET